MREYKNMTNQGPGVICGKSGGNANKINMGRCKASTKECVLEFHARLVPKVK